jgi:membrane associated rhomboid family serine protease
MFRIPAVTRNLIIINFLCFIGMLALAQAGVTDLNNLCGLHFFLASDFQVYQLVTYMFMHGGWEHIILNMFMLWMFGAVVEQVWGGKKFLFYYIFCGVGAGVMQEIAQFFWVYFMLDGQQALSLGDSITVMHQLSSQLNGLTTVGASGGIYALLLAFGMMFPDEKMFIIPIPIPIKAKWMVLGSIAIEFFSALSMPGSNVAHLAHLGGMIFGYFLIRYWRKHPATGLQGNTQFFSISKPNGTPARSITDHHNERSERTPTGTTTPTREPTQEEVDRILDKIRKSGYDSLTREEKQTLFDQSKK